MHSAFRFGHAQATRAYRLEAVDELRAMSQLRACQSEAFVARLSRGTSGADSGERVLGVCMGRQWTQ